MSLLCLVQRGADLLRASPSSKRSASANTEAVLALARQTGGAILTVEDNYAGGIGSELSETAAAAGGPPRMRSLFVRNIPKSGRTPDDLLAYVHLSVPAIVRAATELAGGGTDRPSANSTAPAISHDDV
ncbi:MAG: hypothetical protein ACM3PO_00555 [Betaproteobacteria bacterium]